MSPEEDAFKRGQQDGFLRADVENHERRLNAINGSIERHRAEAIKLRNSIELLSDKVDGVIASLATKAAVDAALQQQLAKANEQQISGRQFKVGVAAVIVALFVGLLAATVTLIAAGSFH